MRKAINKIVGGVLSGSKAAGRTTTDAFAKIAGASTESKVTQFAEQYGEILLGMDLEIQSLKRKVEAVEKNPHGPERVTTFTLILSTVAVILSLMAILISILR